LGILIEILKVLGHYLVDVLPSLAAGFLLSGILHEFVPAPLIEKHLGSKGIKPLLFATILGTFLPICCVGSLPVAVSLRQKGARLGAVIAFLVATPATSVSALLVSYSLLGIEFAAFIFFAVILMGVIIGLLVNIFGFRARENARPVCCCDKPCDTGKRFYIDPVCGMKVSENSELKLQYNGGIVYFCSARCMAKFKAKSEDYLAKEEFTPSIWKKVLFVLRFAFVDMPKDIGIEIIVGLVLAAVIASLNPVGWFVGQYLGGFWGYAFSLVFGIIMYICSTASVPLVHALITHGMNSGAGMVLLIAGPVTSWGTIFVIKSQFGNKMLIFYLTSISVFALAFGYIFSLI